MIARMPYSHAPSMFIYTPNDDQKTSNNFFDTQIFKNSLSHALVPFYPLAGRLKMNDENNRYEVDCNGAGVSFEEVETTHTLSDFEGFKPTPEFRKLVVPTCECSGELSTFPLLLVRVTRFECGGVCLGFGSHHHLADGIGLFFFKTSWARIARGLELEVQPVFDRRLYFTPRNPPQVKFEHLEYGPPLPPLYDEEEKATGEERLFKLSKAQIDSLKLEAAYETHEQPYKLSTYAVLAAHVWRSACKARGLTGDQSVKLYIPTNGRSKLRDSPPLEGYFGNAIFFMGCIAKASDITQQPLYYVACKVHETHKKLENEEYIKSSIDYVESQLELTKIERGFHTVTCPNLSINSWGRMPLYELDFGWGKPKFVGHGGIRCEGQSYLIPSSNNDGSYSLSIKLSLVHMRNFEHYLYDIRSLSSS